MSKVTEKKVQTSVWYTLKKATTKTSEWPDKVIYYLCVVIICIYFVNVNKSL